MSASHLRLVATSSPATPLTAMDRIAGAFERMMADAARMRVAARSLEQSACAMSALAGQIEAKIPLFEKARIRLLVERDRAYEIANDAAFVERRIRESSPGNLTPLTTGLPPRLSTAAATRVA